MANERIFAGLVIGGPWAGKRFQHEKMEFHVTIPRPCSELTNYEVGSEQIHYTLVSLTGFGDVWILKGTSPADTIHYLIEHYEQAFRP